MAATTGFTSIGAALKIGDGTTPTEVFNPIANVTNFDLTQSADQIDATHLQSTSGYREYKQGYKAATCSFEAHFDPDDPTQAPTADGIIEAFETGGTRNYKADFSAADNNGTGKPITAPICSFSGVITELSQSVPTGDMVTVSGTISMSSAPVWGAT